MVTLNDLLSRQKQLLAINDTDVIFPDYAGYSLANLPGSICQWMGFSGIGEPVLDGAYPYSGQVFDQVILLVMDGLGWLRLKDWMEKDLIGDLSFWKDLEAQEHLVPLTSISPSTTCAALTTLNTGRSPASHGNLAYELWLKEYGSVYNMILQTPMPNRGEQAGQLTQDRFNPGFLPVETLDTHIITNGGTVDALHPAAISHSSLSEMLVPRGIHQGYYSLGDLFFRLNLMAGIESGRTNYHYVYWGKIDELSHLYGPDDIRVRLALRDFSRYLRDFRDSRILRSKGRKLLLVTADHGLQKTSLDDEYVLSRHPAFLDLLDRRPTGENRLSFLHCKEGREDSVIAYIEQAWPGKFQLFRTEEVLASRLFGSGEPYSRIHSRMGDLVACPKGDAYLWWSDKANWLIGRHGGLSRDEMLVPLGCMIF
jgi:hypothetical protein